MSTHRHDKGRENKKKAWKMMIEPIQTRVDEFDSVRDNREIVRRGHVNAENEKQTQELCQ